MKYVIMCGGSAFKLNTPKPLIRIDNECLVERTIRLLRNAGVKDIAISTTNEELFFQFGVPIYIHYNPSILSSNFLWLNAFYPMSEPVCYLFGDVYYSPRAIDIIVNTITDDIEFFASAPPFAKEYSKIWAEPFGFKVFNTERFFKCVEQAKKYYKEGRFAREPISWELWQVIKDTPLNRIKYNNYTVINDYTVDIDDEWDIDMLKKVAERSNNG